MSVATHVVNWPGKQVFMCERHAEKALRTARAMGFELSVFLWIGEPKPCKNCENEAEKHAQRGAGGR